MLGVARDLENALRKLGAHGAGLHQCVTSVEAQLSPEVTKQLRFVASVRNTVVHKHDVSDKTVADVRGAAEQATRYLHQHSGAYSACAAKWLVTSAILVAVVVAVVFKLM